MKLIPVIELKDIYYANLYGYFPALLEVTDTVLLHPEAEIGKIFRRKQTIKDYLKSRYNINTKGLKIMMDHGIFVDNASFRQMFSLEKNAENILKVYSVLGIDYGLSFDVPSRLHLLASIELAIAKAGGRADEKLIKSINQSTREEVEMIAEGLSSFTMNSKVSRDKLQKVLKENSMFYKMLKELSVKTIEESLKNLRKQLEIKRKNNYSFLLIPVVQGLFYTDSENALREIVDLLVSYNEFLVENGKRYLYIAIGTSGSNLSEEDAKLINFLLVYGHEYTKKQNINVRFHLLGVNSFDNIRTDLVYSADAVTARRRAVDRKLYVIENGKLKLIEVNKIKEWDCQCPACSKFRDLILKNTSERKTDVRLIHNLWAVSEYVRTKNESQQRFNTFLNY